MMKYLKAEAEIIKFDNSDVVTASVCREKDFVTEQCIQGSNHREQAKWCNWGIWAIVKWILNSLFGFDIASVNETDTAEAFSGEDNVTRDF